MKRSNPETNDASRVPSTLLADCFSILPVLFPDSTDYAGRVPFKRTHRGTYR
ncbi:MAG: hypothetical protein ACXWWE_08540 [Nitrospira sp.]